MKRKKNFQLRSKGEGLIIEYGGKQKESFERVNQKPRRLDEGEAWLCYD